MVTSDPANVTERPDTVQTVAGSEGTILNQNNGSLVTGVEDPTGVQVDPATDTTLRPDAADTVFNTAVNANTDILASDLTPTQSPAIFRVEVALDTVAVFNAQITRGGTTVEYDFNQGNSLTAGSVFQFDHTVRDVSSINYQIETGATVLVLNVDEVQATGP